MTQLKYIAGKTIASFCLLISSAQCLSAETEAVFGKALVAAYENKDHAAYVSLIHPLSREFYSQRDSVAYEKRIDYLVNRKPPTQYSSYDIIIADISEEGLYDPENKAVKLGGRWLVFPVAPSKIITIRVKDEAEGEITEFPHSVQAIVKTEGQWYMLWPTGVLESNAPGKK